MAVTVRHDCHDAEGHGHDYNDKERQSPVAVRNIDRPTERRVTLRHEQVRVISIVIKS